MRVYRLNKPRKPVIRRDMLEEDDLSSRFEEIIHRLDGPLRIGDATETMYLRSASQIDGVRRRWYR